MNNDISNNTTILANSWTNTTFKEDNIFSEKDILNFFSDIVWKYESVIDETSFSFYDWEYNYVLNWYLAYFPEIKI